MLAIHGMELSYPVNKVRFTANKLNLKYDFKKVDLTKGENQSPEFLKISGSGKVPAITDGDFSLSESNAICKYLCRKEGSELYPTDLSKQAKVDQWMDFVSLHVGNAINKLTFNRVFAPAFEMPVSEESIADGEKFLARFLPIVEQQITETRNLASEDLSIADISLLATLDPAEISKVGLSVEKGQTVWNIKIKQEKFYTDCHSDFSEVIGKIVSS